MYTCFSLFLFKFISYLIIRSQLSNTFSLCLNPDVFRREALCYRFSLWLCFLRYIVFILRLNEQKAFFFKGCFLCLLAHLQGGCFKKVEFVSFYHFFQGSVRRLIPEEALGDAVNAGPELLRLQWCLLGRLLSPLPPGYPINILRHFKRLQYFFAAIFGYNHFYFLFYRVLRDRCSSVFYRLYLFSTFNWLFANKMLVKRSLMRPFVLSTLRNNLTYLIVRLNLFLVSSYNSTRLFTLSRFSFFKVNYFHGFLSLGPFRMLLTPGLSSFIIYFTWLLPILMPGREYPEVPLYTLRTMFYRRQAKSFLDYLDVLNRKNHSELIPLSWDQLMLDLSGFQSGLYRFGEGLLDAFLGFLINPLNRVSSNSCLKVRGSYAAFWYYIFCTCVIPFYPLSLARVALGIPRAYMVSSSSAFLLSYKTNYGPSNPIFNGGLLLRLNPGFLRFFCMNLGSQTLRDFFCLSGGVAASRFFVKNLPVYFSVGGLSKGPPGSFTNFSLYLFKNVGLLYFLILTGRVSPKFLKIFNVYMSFFVTYLRLRVLRRRLTVLFSCSLLSKVRLRNRNL